MEGGNLLGLGITLATTVVGTLLAFYLKDWLAERGSRREERREYRMNHMATDRDAYAHRGTVLVRVNLVGYIGRGGWPAGPEDLERLLQNLDHGNHEHFLDPVVEAAWIKFLQKSVLLARRRNAGPLSHTDLNSFHRIRRDFEDAAKRSFGPLPKSEAVGPRPPIAQAESTREAA